MAKRQKKYAGHIHALSNSSPQMCKAMIKHADPGLVKCLCECALNILKGNVPITAAQKRKLSRHKADLRSLAQAKTSAKKKKKILQKGGILPILAKVALPVFTTLLGSVASRFLSRK